MRPLDVYHVFFRKVKTMLDIYITIFTFTVTFILRLILFMVTKKKKSKKDKKETVEKQYLINKFSLDKKKLNTNAINIVISLMDAFIISITLLLSISITDKYILQLLIGLVVVFVLIYVCNEILGSILVKKGYKKDE